MSDRRIVLSLTVAEALWLITTAGREKDRLVKLQKPHMLADNVEAKMAQAIAEAPR